MLNDMQLQQYLDRIGWEGDVSKIEPTKETLDQLIYKHQCAVPFETISIHRPDAIPKTDIETLYDKVVQRKLGGYCFELNKFFEELLRGVGFDVRPVLSRAVRGRNGRMPINHRGMLVEIDGKTYSADVGFGGPMPAGALLLEDGVQQIIHGEEYIPVYDGNGWWRIERMTQAARDAYDDGLPVRRQVELEVCTAPVEDIDFDSMNFFFASPGTLFRDHDVVNLRTENGYKGFRDGVLTLKEGTEKQVLELETLEEINDAMLQHFGMAFD